eukprot:TRINITY_DN15625_c0_g1_i2.p1 TRINITY_DN15625_c0_g1~~TRINITY_DN15625_c0_g1_i2.p1  ORF type:complete len:167 (+),score=36.89 TRINITY_DN15625_c0_g1_i2:64-564(+)
MCIRDRYITDSGLINTVKKISREMEDQAVKHHSKVEEIFKSYEIITEHNPQINPKKLSNAELILIEVPKDFDLSYLHGSKITLPEGDGVCDLPQKYPNEDERYVIAGCNDEHTQHLADQIQVAYPTKKDSRLTFGKKIRRVLKVFKTYNTGKIQKRAIIKQKIVGQ